MLQNDFLHSPHHGRKILQLSRMHLYSTAHSLTLYSQYVNYIVMNTLEKIIPKYNARVIRMSSSLTDVEKQQINILLRKINFIDSKKVLS